MTTLTELTDRPRDGRAFTEPRRGGIGDASPTGRVRLDALARWLQDVAWADVADALGPPDPWIVRRMRLRVEAAPAFAEACAVTTWCSATGPAIAERRTSVVGEAGARVEAVALWVRLDAATGRPLALDEPFFAAYGTAAAGRRARSRLHHPAPPEGLEGTPTWFRAADLDGAGHVNNAVYWALLEEELVGLPPGASIDAEVEHRGPGGVGAAALLAREDLRWVRDAGGEVVASFRLSSTDA